MYKELKYCSRCCMPETTEGIDFDEFGVCKACRASEEKNENRLGKEISKSF